MGGGEEGAEYQVGNLFENLVVRKVTDETPSKQQLLLSFSSVGRLIFKQPFKTFLSLENV